LVFGFSISPGGAMRSAQLINRHIFNNSSKKNENKKSKYFPVDTLLFNDFKS